MLREGKNVQDAIFEAATPEDYLIYKTEIEPMNYIDDQDKELHEEIIRRVALELKTLYGITGLAEDYQLEEKVDKSEINTRLEKIPNFKRTNIEFEKFTYNSI